MADVNAIQQKWQQTFDKLSAAKTDATEQYDAGITQLTALQDQVKNARGLSRLKNHHIRAAKIEPLKDKLRDLTVNIANNKADIAVTARRARAGLCEALIKGSAEESRYNDLGKSLSGIVPAQNAVTSAMQSCDEASSTAYYMMMVKPPMQPIAINNNRDAEDAFRSARQALASLQKQRPRDKIPQIKNPLQISDYNIQSDCQTAISQLQGIADELDKISASLADEIKSLRSAVLTQARAADPAVEKLAASLEACLPEFQLRPGKTQKPANN